MERRGVIINGYVSGPFLLPNPLFVYFTKAGFQNRENLKQLESFLSASIYLYKYPYPSHEIISQYSAIRAHKFALVEAEPNPIGANALPKITCSFALDIPLREGVSADDLRQWEAIHIPLIDLVEIEWHLPGIEEEILVDQCEMRYSRDG